MRRKFGLAQATWAADVGTGEDMRMRGTAVRSGCGRKLVQNTPTTYATKHVRPRSKRVLPPHLQIPHQARWAMSAGMRKSERTRWVIVVILEANVMEDFPRYETSKQRAPCTRIGDKAST